jgi:Rieske Fe-S protein
MPEPRDDPRAPIDARINSPGREGLTGTAPETLYAPIADHEQITIPPDWRPVSAQPAWRRDFPIDWPQDHYVERRDFMKFLVLTSAAFTFGQFWIAAQNWWRAREGRPPMRRVASLDTLPIGGAVVFEYPGSGEMCVLVRLAEDVLVAYSQQCTHLSCAVVPQPAQGVLHCPCHEGYFDLRSGEPVAGPPRRPLPRIIVEIRGRDVYATGVEWRTT